MSNLKLGMKVSRPLQCFLAGAAAWIIALVSNGPEWLNQSKVATAFCTAFTCLGGSLFHYGVRHEMYARKWWDRVVISKPAKLVALGTMFFMLSIAVAALFLKQDCVVVAVANFVAIALYGFALDRVWPFKNITAAAICITPILMGWFAGNRLNPIVPPIIFGTLCVYLAREGIKDAEDVEANRGLRFTLPMMFGRRAAMRVAGLCLIVSMFFYLIAAQYTWPSVVATAFLLLALGLFVTMAAKLLLFPKLEVKFQTIDIGIALLMLAVLGMRAGLP